MNNAISFKSCLHCTRRQVGCHSTCEDYITAKKQYEAVYQNRKKARLEDSITDPKNQVHGLTIRRTPKTK